MLWFITHTGKTQQNKNVPGMGGIGKAPTYPRNITPKKIYILNHSKID